MAANVQLLVWHGAAGAKSSTALTDGQTIRFKQADNDTVDLNNKIPVPSSGTNYSYAKNLQFSAVTTPSNLIDNLKVYSDGSDSLGTGVDILVKTSAAYVDPTTTTTTAVAGTSSLFGYTAGSALSVAGSLANPNTGAFGDFIVLQMAVTSAAGPGNVPPETMTLQYDEA